MLAATRVWVYLIELAVGGGCLVAAAGALRSRMRSVAAALFVAGIAAAVHAIAVLVAGHSSH